MMRTFYSYSLSNFQVCKTYINYSCHTVLYIPVTYFIMKFVHFDFLNIFLPSTPQNNYPFLSISMKYFL